MADLAVALMKAAALIQRLEDHGLLEDRTWKITQDPQSPWICVDAVPYHPIDDGRLPAYRFAIWRRTGDLFALGPDGAVGDEPITIESVQP